VKRWCAKSSEQLLAELGDVQAYEIEFENKTYQVEVEVLENTEKYVHVMVAVDELLESRQG
jgi:DNA relaxase NicK